MLVCGVLAWLGGYCLAAPRVATALALIPDVMAGLPWQPQHEITAEAFLGPALLVVVLFGVFMVLHGRSRTRYLKRVAERLEDELAERRRAEERANRLLDQQMALHHLALAVAESHSPRDVLRHLHEQVRRHTGAVALAITRVGRDGEAPTDLYLPTEDVLYVAPPVARCTQAEQEAWRAAVAGGQAVPLTVTRATARPGEAALFVPMTMEDGSPGVARLYAAGPEAFSQEESGLLVGMASLCGVALRNARLFADAAGRAQRLGIVNRVASAVGAILDLDRLMETVYQELVPLFTPDAFLIGLYLPESEQVDYRVLVDEGVRDEPHIEPIGGALIAHVVQHNQTLLLRHTTDPVRTESAPLLWGTGRNPESWLGVPMRLAGRVIGVISVQAYRPEAYDEEDSELLATIADQIAMAVENARLYEGERREAAERQLLEAQLREARKMEAIGQLAGGIAHDFNNLLMVINGYSQLALSILRPDDPVHMDVQEVLSAGERAATLTRQLLAFSRRQILEIRSLELNGLLERLQPALAGALGQGVTLHLDLTPEPWLLRADPAQLEQVVRHLVQNAVEAMPQGGQVTLGTRNVSWQGSHTGPLREMPPGDYAVLHVQDTGMGMSDEVQQHLFEPFYTTKGVTRTGLGLATVYGTVKQSNGHIAFKSQVGQGTTFSIYLPRIWREPAEEATPPGPDASEAARYTILLVEDEEVVREMTNDALTRRGYAVLQAQDGAEALRLAQSYPDVIHLMLTDVIMPKLSGPQVAARLREQRPELRVLYMSGYADDTLGEHGVVDESVAFLQKPFAATALLSKVAQVLGARPAAGA